MTPELKAIRKKGAEAFFPGKNMIEECPYDGDTLVKATWIEGWCQQEEYWFYQKDTEVPAGIGYNWIDPNVALFDSIKQMQEILDKQLIQG